MELDEILAVDQAARRGKRGDDDKLVAGFRIDDAMQLMRFGERDGDAGAIAADQVAVEIERVARLGNRIADLHGPDRTVDGDAGQPRPIELDADDVGVGRPRQIGAANSTGRFVLQRAEIDVDV